MAIIESRRRMRSLTLILLVTFFTGCFSAYPTCSYTFRNDSSDQIWVDRIEGFAHGMGCGNLMPSDGDEFAIAGIHGISRKSELNQAATIVWWRTDEPANIFRTEVDLPKSLPRNHEIDFVLNEDGVWTAKLKKRNL